MKDIITVFLKAVLAGAVMRRDEHTGCCGRQRKRTV